MAHLIQTKKLTILLLLCSFSLIRNLQAEAEADVNSTIKDTSALDNRNLHGSSRRLAQSETKPEIIITKGQYNDDFVGIRSLKIRYSASNASWIEIECTLQRREAQYSSFSPTQWSIVRTWNPCPPMVKITDFSDEESYRFTIQGVPASESGKVKATSRWKIDHTPPRTILRTNCSQECTKNRKTFAFYGVDGNGVASYQCKLNNKAWFPCTSPYTARTRRRNDAVHTFQVAAVDRAGNIDPSPAAISWYSNNGSFLPTGWPSGAYWATTTEDEESGSYVWVGILLFTVLPCLSCLSPCIIGYCCYRKCK